MSKGEVGQVLKDAMRFLRITAARPSEMRKLKWENIHFEQRLIIIPEHKTSETTKVRKPRKFPILGAMEILERRKKAYGHIPYVFTMAGKPWSMDIFGQRVKRARKRAGLDGKDQNGERLSAYHLRHARISEALYGDKLDLPTVQQMAGHDKLETTARYLHRSDDDYVQDVEQGRKRGEKKGMAD
jgi:integrase